METVTTRSLLRQLHYYHTNLEQSRLKLHEAIKNLYFEDPESKHVLIVEGLVEKAMDCHLRPQKTKGKKKATKCLVCIADGKGLRLSKQPKLKFICRSLEKLRNGTLYYEEENSTF